MNLPYFPPVGGADKTTRQLLDELARRGHQTRAVVTALGSPPRLTHGEFLQELSGRGVAVRSTDGVDVFEWNGVEVHAVVDRARLRARLVEQLASFAPDWVLVTS